MFQVGLSGGIGSGKSVIALIFNTLKIPVFNADVASKHICNTNSFLISEFNKAFGDKVYQNNLLQSKLIAEKFFVDTELKKYFENIIHPIVYEEYNAWVNLQDSSYVIHENALMFGSDSYKKFNKTIFVSTTTELQIERVIKRNNFTKEQVLERMSNQPNPLEACGKANFIIHNTNQQLIIPQVLHIHSQILKEIYG